VSDFEDLDFYELLGVPRTAAPDEIKRAYRREISKYHPDRFASASPAEQEYASRRSQRLTEAYTTLNNFAARTAYNLGKSTPRRQSTPPAPQRPAPPQQRDHQAELYSQARDHLDAGRTLQAVGVLRQLQQINPFYRDSAELLAAAEGRLREAASPPEQPARHARPLIIAAGTAGALALTAFAAWTIGARITPTSAGLAPTTLPTIQPAAVATTAPTSAPTNAPTSAPTSTPTVAPPTVVPTALPPTIPPVPSFQEPQGTVVLEDNFASDGWAAISGSGWSVGYQGEQYRIAVDAGIGTIWSYRSVQAQNVVIAADVQVNAGEGGLLLRFFDASSYLTFTVDPERGTYRLAQSRGNGAVVLAEGTSDMIRAGVGEANRLAAITQGNRVQVVVNNRLLAEIESPNLPQSQRFGLVAISGATAAEALFDNLSIRALE
jgi:hypothetical protein